jgi:hypothetical protein
VEAEGGLTSTLAYFPFALGDNSGVDLFAPVLILSTPTFDVVTVTAVLDTAIPEGALAFKGTLVLGATLASGVDFEWVAFARVGFTEAVSMPFGAADVLSHRKISNFGMWLKFTKI